MAISCRPVRTPSSRALKPRAGLASSSNAHRSIDWPSETVAWFKSFLTHDTVTSCRPARTLCRCAIGLFASEQVVPNVNYSAPFRELHGTLLAYTAQDWRGASVGLRLLTQRALEHYGLRIPYLDGLLEACTTAMTGKEDALLPRLGGSSLDVGSSLHLGDVASKTSNRSGL